MVPMPSTKATAPPAQVQDFTALPLQYPATPSYPKETTHYLYLRQNAPRIPTPDTPRELFLVNVPVDATATNLRALSAERLGGARVEDVEFEDSSASRGKGIKAMVVRSEGKRSKKRKRGADSTEEGEEVGLLPETWDHEMHRSGATAVLRFVDATSAQLALREARKSAKAGRRILWSSARDAPALGAARYSTHHALLYPEHTALQESTDAYMAAFAAREAESARQLALKRSEPDEDGFVTVVRGGRNPAARALQQQEPEDGGARKKKKAHKGNVEEGFYRFQVREKRKREHGELAKKFEEDARRVEEMRKRRGRVRPE